MRQMIVSALATVMLTATLGAQDVEGPRDEGPHRDRGGRGPSIARLVERLNEQVGFDDEQTARINEIVAVHEARVEEMRAKWQELRAAMEGGDEQRAAELRDQLRQQRGEPGRMIQAFFDEIEPVLHEDQREAFQQFREDFARRPPGPGGERGRMRQMMRDLPDAVNMTEEQRAAFDELLARRRETMRERMRERPQPGGAEGLEGAGPLGPPDFAAMQDELFQEISGILNEDQQELLAEYWAPIEAETRARERREADDFRIVLLAAKRVRDLSREQQEQWRAIMREAMRSFRDLRRTDAEGKAALAADVKTRVVKLLGEDQKAAFERNLERLTSRGGGHRDRGSARTGDGERVRKGQGEAEGDGNGRGHPNPNDPE